MKCNYCGREIGNSAPHVTVVINRDLTQNYCGTPYASDEDGLSCWQRTIEAWHRLIQYEQTVPLPLSSLPPVRRFVRS